MKKWILLCFCIIANSFATDSLCPNLFNNLSPLQKNAVKEAHLVGSGEEGKNGALAGIENYTNTQLRRKAKILKNAGFSLSQRRELMESGSVGIMLVGISIRELRRKEMQYVDINSLTVEELRQVDVKKLTAKQIQQLDMKNLTHFQLYILNEHYYDHLTSNQRHLVLRLLHPGAF